MKWLFRSKVKNLNKSENASMPICICSRESFILYRDSVFRNRENIELKIAQNCLNSKNKTINIDGFCDVCGRATKFGLDFLYSNSAMPNYRERLVCPYCNLNNRQRFIVAKIRKEYTAKHKIYMYEQITSVYQAIKKVIPSVIGSEYISENLKSGTIQNGILHEDAECLSFSDGSFDLIISCDVFEHVNDYHKCFSEAARVLKKGGKLLISVPFNTEQDDVFRRAEISDGKIIYHAEPVYHGNPMSSEGSLVFWDYGWKLLDDIKSAGFQDVYMLAYYSEENGHLGGIPFVFEAVR